MAESFKQAVARRVAEKMADYHAVQAIVEYKMARFHGYPSVPMPRTPEFDQLELARVAAYARAKAVQHRADQMVQEYKAARGDAEYIDVPANAPPPQAVARGRERKGCAGRQAIRDEGLHLMSVEAPRSLRTDWYWDKPPREIIEATTRLLACEVAGLPEAQEDLALCAAWVSAQRAKWGRRVPGPSN